MPRKTKSQITEEPVLFGDAQSKTIDAEPAKVELREPATPRKRRTEVAVAKPTREVARQPAAITAPQSDLATVLATFERLAVNPAVNPDALGKLLDIQERLLDRNARAEFDRHFVEMQPELPVITKDGRIIVRAKDARTGERTGAETQNTPYATWEAIDAEIKPILHKHGFALNHRFSSGAEGKVRITAILRGWGHTDDSCYVDLPADTTGSKNNLQAWGSSTKYGLRYTGCAVLNIITVGEDDDGKASGRPVLVGDPISPAQLDQIILLAGAVQCGEPRLVKHLNTKRPKGHPILEKIADLPVSRFDETIEALRSLEPHVKEKGAK